MIVGRSSRPGDIDVNVCKKKHHDHQSATAAGAEEALKITGLRDTYAGRGDGVHRPTTNWSSITPKSFRTRKRELSAANRKKMLADKDDSNN